MILHNQDRQHEHEVNAPDMREASAPSVLGAAIAVMHPGDAEQCCQQEVGSV